jgi:hypothetical protein
MAGSSGTMAGSSGTLARRSGTLACNIHQLRVHSCRPSWAYLSRLLFRSIHHPTGKEKKEKNKM